MKKMLLFRCFTLSLSKPIFKIWAPILLACVFAVQLNGQMQRISIQGTLKSASGSSVADGTYAVTFKLYTVETGGTALWEEDAMVEVVGGIYSHYLGSVTPLNPAHFVNTLYLGVRVGSYELIPRTELSYSPYAFSVAFAQKVVCSGAVGDIKYSILNPTQFAAENGACWVPMDGRMLATTDKLRQVYGITTLPDGGGLFIRGQEFSGGADNDAGRTSASTIATIQQDDLESHTHTMNSSGAHTHDLITGREGDDSGGGGSADELTFHPTSLHTSTTTSNGAHTHTINNTGGTETRPKNLNFWVYIRIN